jgi:hypothetical protein
MTGGSAGCSARGTRPAGRARRGCFPTRLTSSSGSSGSRPRPGRRASRRRSPCWWCWRDAGGWSGPTANCSRHGARRCSCPTAPDPPAWTATCPCCAACRPR